MLERYFHNSLHQSHHVLSPQISAFLKAEQLVNYEHDSLVSRALVTRVNEKQIGFGWLLLMSVLVIAERNLSRRVRRRA